MTLPINHWLSKKIGFTIEADMARNVQQALAEVAKEMHLSQAQLTQGLLNKTLDPTLFIDHFVINESFFFRYKAQMLAIISERIRPLIKQGKTPRILHLPCAAGEEPYSFAILLQETGINLNKVDIHGVDISTSCIQRAKKGIYTEYDFRRTSKLHQLQFFTPLSEQRYRLSDMIKKQVTFHRLNVFEGIEPLGGRFDVIFFNNLLIYLDPPHVTKILAILKSCLDLNGCLVVDNTELPKCRTVFKPISIGNVSALQHPDAASDASLDDHHAPLTSTKRPLSPTLKPKKDKANSRKEDLQQLEASIEKLKNETPPLAGNKNTALIEQAKRATIEKKFTEATALYTRIAEQTPDDRLHALYALSQLYADQGNDIQSIETAESALAESKQQPNKLDKSQRANLHGVLALCLHKKGLNTAAQEHIKQVKALDADHPIGKLYTEEKPL